MQTKNNVKQLLRECFGVEPTDSGEFLKVHTKEIKNEQFEWLSAVSGISHSVKAKRSGTGITVIVKV